jgi:hypothetical protein
MDQPPAIVADQEEHIDNPISEGLNDQKIHRPDPPEFVAQKRPPGLAAAGHWLSPPIASDGALAHDDAELEKLASNTLGTPQTIVP